MTFLAVIAHFFSWTKLKSCPWFIGSDACEEQRDMPCKPHWSPLHPAVSGVPVSAGVVFVVLVTVSDLRVANECSRTHSAG